MIQPQLNNCVYKTITKRTVIRVHYRTFVVYAASMNQHALMPTSAQHIPAVLLQTIMLFHFLHLVLLITTSC